MHATTTRSNRPARRTRRAAAALTLGFAGLAACGGGDDEGRTRIEFFQFKGEAIEIFKELVTDFEAEHPEIDIVQNDVPDADTAIRTRLVRGDVPDVMTLNANGRFGQLALAGVFYDFSEEPVLQDVNPAIVEILTDLGTGGEGEVNGVPFANNADGVIYNKDLFAEYGVEVPETYDQLLEVARTFQDAGIPPFYVTLKDAWTSLPVWNALASNLQPDDFWATVDGESVTFRDTYPLVAERMTELLGFGQEDRFSRDYNTGNQQFAEGGVPMYLQGVWAIPAIRTYNPEFEIGTFALPTDDPETTRLVSGIDVVLTMPKNPDHKAEALTFIEFLMQPDVMMRYTEAQAAIPTLAGLTSEDPALAGLLPFFEQERLVGFTDHQIPPSIPLEQINQEFLIDGDQEQYLSTLDNEWQKYLKRRPER